MNKGGMVPDLSPSFRIMGMTRYFDDVRGQVGVIDNPLTMSSIEGWQRHAGIELEKWERECLFQMDRAFRRAYSDVVKYHADRVPVKALMKPKKDWKKAGLENKGRGL